MAQRPIWRGHLRLALVSCPVALYSARHDRGAIRFNMINPATGNRIRMVTQDAETGDEISRGDTVKGFEFEKGRYVILTDDDFDKVKVESTSLMKVEKFVEASSIDPVYYDASYYLAPDGKGADDVYAVLREAIRSTGKVALTRIVISQRERTIAVRPMDGGLVAHTLNEERDLNSSATLFDSIRSVEVDPEMLALAVQLVDRQTGAYDPSDLEDQYETRLRQMIDAKVAGQDDIPGHVPTYSDANVIDIMAALKKSLGQTAAREVLPVAKQAAGRKKKASAPEQARQQPSFKLPIEGGRKTAKPVQKVEEAPTVERARPTRRRAS